ncbi:hypothetical protein G6F40_016773 [Rhizopus arrhizus]|nr:hypothetical protein G6F40_016773 [Rhizopus arrhizus]
MQRGREDEGAHAFPRALAKRLSGTPQPAQQWPRHCPLPRASLAPVQVGYFRRIHRRARRRPVGPLAHFRVVACVLAPQGQRAARPLGEFARAVRGLLS